MKTKICIYYKQKSMFFNNATFFRTFRCSQVVSEAFDLFF